MKKIIIIFLILLILAGCLTFYLNKVVLPTKIKSLIVQGLSEQTQKNVSITSLQFSIFKGLVVKDLKIYDKTQTMLSVKEASCTFFIFPIFTKRIIIPTVVLRSPVIFVQRRKDSTFNIQDFFLERKEPGKKQEFSISVSKISIRQARLDFQDDTFDRTFTKSINNLNFDLFMSLPASVKFNLKAEMPGDESGSIRSSGEYKIPQNQFLAKVNLKDFSPREFLPYYQESGLSIRQGLIDASLDLKFADKALYSNIRAEVNNLDADRKDVSAVINSELSSFIKYNTENKQVEFSGKLTLMDSSFSVAGILKKAEHVNADISFNNSGATSEEMTGVIQGLPARAKLKITDFSSPTVEVALSLSPDLAVAQNILKERFDFSIPGKITGNGNLNMTVTKPWQGAAVVNGRLDILNAALTLDKISSPFESIKGVIEFNQNQLKWTGLNFKYQNTLYKSQGQLNNFKAPGIGFNLSSDNLQLQATLALNNKIITLSELSGTYFSSQFSVSGNINTLNLQSELAGDIDSNLADSAVYFKQLKNQVEKIKPDGRIKSVFQLSGPINDFKSCDIKAQLSSAAFSLYGLKAGSLLVDYNQSAGVVDIPSLRFSLYGGSINAAIQADLRKEGLPFWLSANMQNVRLEQLKLDTPLKNKNISGTIQADLKINSVFNDIGKLNGAGKINIKEGRLWELNLFKGFGTLIFVKNLELIVFHDGSCDFTIANKTISTRNLDLKSDIAEIRGRADIGLDGSVDASLDVNVIDEAVPLTGTFKDITTAIIGQAGRFGVIRITGTLQDPKFKFMPAVVDIIKGITDTFFRR